MTPPGGVAGNRLVVIVPAAAAGKSPPTGFKDLADPALKRVAIGEYRTVSAGSASCRSSRLSNSQTRSAPGRLLPAARATPAVPLRDFREGGRDRQLFGRRPRRATRGLSRQRLGDV